MTLTKSKPPKRKRERKKRRDNLFAQRLGLLLSSFLMALKNKNFNQDNVILKFN